MDGLISLEAMKSKSPKRPEYKLNEPSPKIPGGPTRRSVRIPGRRPPAIARRERLNELLRAHDPDTAQRWLAKITPSDYELLRQIAKEGVATGSSPSLRQNAIVALSRYATAENLNLLTELATQGEDVYVRSHALVALGRCGLALALPVLREGLAAADPMEAASAERGLEALTYTLGAEILVTGFADEKRKAVLARRKSVSVRLMNRESRKPQSQAIRHVTVSRPRGQIRRM
jgi:hypothetical protein